MPPGDVRPRRLLAIDGGGVRGVVALEVIAGIERVLRAQTGDPDLRLGDWFDYIAGTSTGAIVAAGLALGRTSDDLLELYERHAHDIFRPAEWWDRVRHRYDARGLTEILQREFGAHTTLGSDALRCLLMVGLRNASTDSPWPLSSNPRALFNAPGRPDSNLQVPLWQLVRASTAAPTYFPAERITFADGSEHVFSDGATTPLNNPSLQLALMATLPEYRLEWPTGPDRMLLVSVGTGSAPHIADAPADRLLWHHANEVPASLIHSVGVQQDLMCRVLGEVRHAPPIDTELGTLAGSRPGRDPLFAYVRYDRPLDAEGAGDAVTGAIDEIAAIPALRTFGRAIAADIRAEHLAPFT